MATVGALNQLVGGLHKGFNAGFEYGGKMGKSIATRKMGKAEKGLQEYLAYDPSKKPGAVGKDGKPPLQPTLRDLTALRAEYHDAARIANDPDFAQKADARWASKLQEGYKGYLQQAQALAQGGDWDGAQRAMEHASGLAPNGMNFNIRRNDKGQMVVKGRSERTGQLLDEKVMTDRDFQMLLLQAEGDPMQWLQAQNAQREWADGRVQALAEAARAARMEPVIMQEKMAQIAKLHSEDQLNTARGKALLTELGIKGELAKSLMQYRNESIEVRLFDIMTGGGKGDTAAEATRDLHNDLAKRMEEAVEQGFFNADGQGGLLKTGDLEDIGRVAHNIVDMYGMSSASEALEQARALYQRKQANPDDPYWNSVLNRQPMPTQQAPAGDAPAPGAIQP